MARSARSVDASANRSGSNVSRSSHCERARALSASARSVASTLKHCSVVDDAMRAADGGHLRSCASASPPPPREERATEQLNDLALRPRGGRRRVRGLGDDRADGRRGDAPAARDHARSASRRADWGRERGARGDHRVLRRALHLLCFFFPFFAIERGVATVRATVAMEPRGDVQVVTRGGGTASRCLPTVYPARRGVMRGTAAGL